MPRENVCLTVRPLHDLTTEVLATKLAPHAIAYAKSRFYTVYDLYNGYANRVHYEASAPLRDPIVIFTFSHGGDEAVIGDDGVTPFLDVHNTWTTNKRLIYHCACHTGKKLAPAEVDIGARAVLAFADTLTIVIDKETHEPVEGFKEVLVDKPCLLFDGVMVKDVHSETIKEYDRWIDYWDEKDPVIADTLRHDRDNFKLFGAGESRIRVSWYLILGHMEILTFINMALYAILSIVRMRKRWRR